MTQDKGDRILFASDGVTHDDAETVKTNTIKMVELLETLIEEEDLTLAETWSVVVSLLMSFIRNTNAPKHLTDQLAQLLLNRKQP